MEGSGRSVTEEVLFLQWGKAEGGAGLGSFRWHGDQRSRFELVNTEILTTFVNSWHSISVEFNLWLIESLDVELVATKADCMCYFKNVAS